MTTTTSLRKGEHWAARTGFLLLLLLVLPAVVQAQFNYTITNGTITITGYTGPGGDVTIPDTISGLPVTSIGYHAFWGCTSLTSVTLARLRGLEGVTLRNSLEINAATSKVGTTTG